MNAEISIRLLAGVLLTAANAFFVTTEFALTRVRQLPKHAFQGTSSLRLAWRMTERLEIYLTGCQLGITASSILLGVVAEPAVTRILQPATSLLGLDEPTTHLVSITLAVVLINLVHAVYGEQAPTYLGVERPRAVARYLAPLLYWWVKITSPIIYVGDGLAKASLRPLGISITRSWTRGEAGEGEDEELQTHADLMRKMGELLSRGALEEERRREVLKALEIGAIPVKEIMVPRDRVVALSTVDSMEESLRVISEHHYVRFPIAGEEGDGFVGMVYLPAVVRRLDRLKAGEVSLRDIAEPLVTVGAEQPVSDVIDTLQDAKQEAALVEEGGEVVGFVTITDTFEAIAGELRDPFD